MLGIYARLNIATYQLGSIFWLVLIIGYLLPRLSWAAKEPG